MLWFIFIIFLALPCKAEEENRTQQLSKISAVCDQLQLNLCVQELCPAFCYDTYGKWHHSDTLLTKECILRCTKSDLCEYTGMPKKNGEDSALDRQLRAQMIMCMKEAPTAENHEMQPQSPVDKEKHKWANFETEEWKPIAANGKKLNEEKNPLPPDIDRCIPDLGKNKEKPLVEKVNEDIPANTKS